MDIRASPATEAQLVSWLEQQGLDWTVMIQDVGVLMQQELVAAGPKLSTKHNMDWLSYHPLEDIYGWFDYLEETYDFCEKEIIGQSYEGQDMIVMKVRAS